MEEMARIFTSVHIGGQMKEEATDANLNFKKEPNDEVLEVAGPLTLGTTSAVQQYRPVKILLAVQAVSSRTYCRWLYVYGL